MFDGMIKVIYKELPIGQVSYLTRPEFSPTGQEKEFYNFLKNSMSKHGFKDPVHIEYGGEDYGDILKVLVGNNRMTIAEELGIDKVPTIIVNYKADTFKWNPAYMRCSCFSIMCRTFDTPYFSIYSRF